MYNKNYYTCKITNIACFILAGSGSLPLLAIIYGRLEPFAPAAISLVSLALGLIIIERNEGKNSVFITTLLIGLGWLAAFSASENGALLGIVFGFLASVYALINGGYEAGLAVYAATFVPFLVVFSWSSESVLVASIGYMILAGLVASSLVERIHPLVISLASPVALLLGPQGALSLVSIAFMLAISMSRATVKIGCPFNVDSGLLFYGSIIGGVGSVIIGLEGLNSLSVGLWALGFILQLASVLVPLQPRVSFSS